jgi:hypothetical protein
LKLRDVRDAIDTFSGKTSDIVRQLGFAGIAIVWVFRIEGSSAGEGLLPKGLVWPVVFIVLTLGLDLAQYVAGTIIWSWFNRTKEKEGVSQEEEFTAPRSINRPTYVLFWAKVVTVSIAYFLLAAYMYDRLF